MYKQFFKKKFVNQTKKLVSLGIEKRTLTSIFFRCEIFIGSRTAGFIKQEIKLVSPNALFRRFAQQT